MPTRHLAQDDAADELLSRDPLALPIGMLLTSTVQAVASRGGRPVRGL